MTMLKQLALSVEYYWISCILGAAPLNTSTPMRCAITASGATTPAARVTRRSLHRSETIKRNEIVARLALDARPLDRDPHWGEWNMTDLLFFVMHVLEETAAHAGHLDAVRELIDGCQQLVL